MAITDIPEFVEFSPGDTIRSEDWNSIQRQVRNSVRVHHHTRLANAVGNDAATDDAAVQVGTDEIADQAVTSTKLASGAVTAGKLADASVTNTKLGDLSVSTNKLQDAAVTAQKLAANAVARNNIQDDAVNRPKLAIQDVATSTATLAAGSAGPATVTALVRANVQQAQAQFFFPMLTITSTTGAANLVAQIEAALQFRRSGTATGDTVDVFIRLTNTGGLGANVTWRVVTFAP